MVKVLGISGSPRKNGNSETLLDKTLEAVVSKGYEIEKIRLNELKITPCQECGGCDFTGKCIIDDDMQKIYPKLFSCNALILSSPIFFAGLTAQTKAFIDRCQCLWVAKYILKKVLWDTNRKGAFISVCGSDFSYMFKGAKYTVKAIFNTLDFSFEGELLLKNIDECGDINTNSKALQSAFELGTSIVNLYKINH